MQANVFGKIRFDLVAGGQLVGAIQAENWRAWDFAITDAAGTEVARITKKWEGLARTMFTTADRYVVLVHYRLPEPLASMVVAVGADRGHRAEAGRPRLQLGDDIGSSSSSSGRHRGQGAVPTCVEPTPSCLRGPSGPTRHDTNPCRGG